MRVVVCALAKNEHLYINDWVAHYVKIGVDKIYIYDNDDLDKPLVNECIDEKYLGKCEIIDIRGVHKNKLQQEIYTTFYNTHNFDWCLYCDIDEFLFGVNNIHLWLESWQFRHINQIRIKWKLFGDDNLVTRDMSKPVFSVFKKEVKSSLNRNLKDSGSLENQGKAIVRGGLKNVVVTSPHFASFFKRDNVIPSMLPSGRPCWSKIIIKEDYSRETIYMHHYMTKTISEFINQKMNRTDAVFGDTIINLDYFWRINEKTQEKLDYIKKMGISG